MIAPFLAVVACAACHPAEAKGHAATLMARTLERGEEAHLLRAKPELTYKLGAYSYLVRRDGDRNMYTVSGPEGTLTAPIRWAVGQGEAGQTYVLERDGKLYESWVSYYNHLQRLEVTIGTPPRPPVSLEEAFGREMKPRDVVECFSCHSAPTEKSAGIDKGTLAWTEALAAGVQCENCHAGSAKHAAARAAGDLKTAKLQRLKTLTTEEMSDSCGTCHRTWAHIQVNGPRGIGNVRFQPYRIAHSKCYDAVDRRIACTTCHDPHKRAETITVDYDSACKACHHKANGAAKPAPMCRVSENRCASCHMPKYEIPGSYFRFTDHFIRIVRPNETYPD